MSYIKTEWETGDKITAEKLNNVESGIEEINVSYEKTTWETGDTITAVKLNNIETGIEEAGSSDFTTAEVTIHFTFEEYADDLTNVVCTVPNGLTNNGVMMAMQSAMSNINAGATSADFTYTMPLYKNSASIVVDWAGVSATEARLQLDYDGTVTATGNATVDVDNNLLITVTGDCTITIPIKEFY